MLLAAAGRVTALDLLQQRRRAVGELQLLEVDLCLGCNVQFGERACGSYACNDGSAWLGPLLRAKSSLLQQQHVAKKFWFLTRSFGDPESSEILGLVLAL